MHQGSRETSFEDGSTARGDERAVEEYRMLTNASMEITEQLMRVLTLAVYAAIAILAYAIDKENWAIALLPVPVLASAGLWVLSEVQRQVMMDAYVVRYHESRSTEVNFYTMSSLVDAKHDVALRLKKVALFPLCFLIVAVSCSFAYQFAAGDPVAEQAVLGSVAAFVVLVGYAIWTSRLNRGKLAEQWVREFERVERDGAALGGQEVGEPAPAITGP